MNAKGEFVMPGLEVTNSAIPSVSWSLRIHVMTLHCGIPPTTDRPLGAAGGRDNVAREAAKTGLRMPGRSVIVLPCRFRHNIASASRMTLRSVAQQLSYRLHEHTFDLRRDIRGSRLGFVAALFVRDGSADIPRRVVAVSGHGD